jgi:hypothetical protein
MIAKTTPYYCLFFNLPRSFFVYNGDTENTEIFFMVSLFIGYFLVCSQGSEEQKLFLLRVLCVSCCFLFFSATNSRPMLNGR